MKRSLPLPVLQALPDGSYLSEIHMRDIGRTRIDAGKIDDIRLATHIPVRVVEYTVENVNGTPGEPVRVITSVLDPDLLSATTVAVVYKERWELELTFREIECQLRQSGTTLRSKSPAMVRQEIWGLLLAHWAVRAFMAEAADSIDVDPDRVSTIRAINIVRRSVTDRATFSP